MKPKAGGMEEEMAQQTGAAQAIETLVGLASVASDSYEVFLMLERGLTVEAKDGSVDSFKARSSMGVGLRTITGARAGFGYTTVVDKKALAEMVKNVIESSAEAAEDSSLAFAGPPVPPPVPPVRPELARLDLVDDSFLTVSEDDKIARAIAIEESTRGYDKRVKRVRGATYSESFVYSRVVNSSGVDAAASATFYTGSVMAVADENGSAEMGYGVSTGHKIDDVDALATGREAGSRAVAMLGAETPKSGRYAVLLENTVVIELLGSLAPAFYADNVHKGKSMLAGKKGKKVASGLVNLSDDGLLRGGWSSSLFDAEGVARQTTPLLTEGVLSGYLYDTYWATRERAVSTGSASRSGVKTSPTVGISNLYIKSGEIDFEGLMKAVGAGFVITDLMGVHTINPVTGEFSLGATGYRIESGSRGGPVRGMAVSGNLLDLFMNVEEVGSDMRFIGSMGSPSLLVKEIEISGE